MLFLALYHVFKSMEPLYFDNPTETYPSSDGFSGREEKTYLSSDGFMLLFWRSFGEIHSRNDCKYSTQGFGDS